MFSQNKKKGVNENFVKTLVLKIFFCLPWDWHFEIIV